MEKYNQIRKSRLQIADAGCVITRNKSDIYHLLSGSQIQAFEAASLLIDSIVSSLHDIEDNEEQDMYKKAWDESHEQK